MNKSKPTSPAWFRGLNMYQDKSRQKAGIQIINSFVPYFSLWAVLIYFVNSGFPYWATFLVSFAAACFLVRIFIVFHDCVHSSFYKKQWANTAIGYIAGTLTFTAFHSWRASHLTHHATNGKLDHRGDGDVWTMTTAEYRQSSKFMKLVYRVFRNPAVMFLIGPAFMFLFVQRYSGVQGRPKARNSVIITNLLIAGIIVGMGYAIGFSTYFIIQLPVMLMAGTMGIWLFYVQHQFSPGYWKHDEEWSSLDAAIHGSSHYDLPRFLQWISGNIGFHSLHHLKPGIPNYNLQSCYESTPELQESHRLTFWESLKTIRHKLWSEEINSFVTFREAKKLAT